MSIKEEIGKKIKHYRILNNLTIKELADKIDVSTSSIMNCESGRKFSIDILIKISEILKIQLKDLFDFHIKQNNRINDIINLCTGKNDKQLKFIIEMIKTIDKYL